MFPLSTDCAKNIYLNEIYINLSGLKDEALSKCIIDTVMRGNSSEPSKYINAFLVLSPWVRLLCALLMMIVMVCFDIYRSTAVRFNHLCHIWPTIGRMWTILGKVVSRILYQGYFTDIFQKCPHLGAVSTHIMCTIYVLSESLNT